MTADTAIYALRRMVEQRRSIALSCERHIWHLEEVHPQEGRVMLANGIGLEDVIDQAFAAMVRKHADPGSQERPA